MTLDDPRYDSFTEAEWRQAVMLGTCLTSEQIDDALAWGEATFARDGQAYCTQVILDYGRERGLRPG